MSNAVTSTGILVKRGPIPPLGSVVITSNTINAVATVVLTASPHGLASGDEVTIAGVAGSTPTINGARVVTVVDATHFSVPVVTTVGGTGGTVQPNYGTVGELTEVTPGGMSRNKVDTTTHNDGSESHVLGILRQSDPSMKINYVGSDATHVAILADIQANVKSNWKIVLATVLPQSGGSAPGSFNDLRHTVNASMRADPSFYDALDDIGNVGTTMGADSAADDTSLYAAGLHPTLAGHNLLSPEVAAAINAYR
jgi:hypothetical protein